MNWFAWIVIVVGSVLALFLLYELLWPRRGGVSGTSRRRERDMGEGMYRGGRHGTPWDGSIGGP